MRSSGACVLILGFAAAAAGQPTSVVSGPHNLSAGGPGPVRATMESQVCIFCHAPHNASPIRPLWNRADPMESYTIYTSPSLDARPGQPTGTSKMCLSCHDGTIALGSVLSRGMQIQMAGGITTIPPGAANIGTDLRDDHPVSFRYDSVLAAKDLKLRSPAVLPHEIRLDVNSELQCTACHDAHDNSRGSFLVMRNEQSQLCISCHQMGGASTGVHQQCADCHRSHSAPSGPYLLRAATTTDTCLRCHNGLIQGAANIAADMNKASVHDEVMRAGQPQTTHPATGCTDCHEPHTMARGRGIAPGIAPSLGRISGVNASGAAARLAQFEYEACFKCHGDRSKLPPTVPRRIAQNNTRLQFSPSAVSFHPVETQGRNPDVPSLRPGWTTSSIIYCSDCHGSESGTASGGAGPSGVHGSNFAPLLSARYETTDWVSESEGAYALCYRCHDRASILSDASFPGHRRHIVDLRTSCATCHDAHGIASGQGSSMSNSNLINFATNIVLPDRATGRLEFRDTGLYSGQCFLSCHGVDHSPKTYPTLLRSGAPTAPPRRSR